MKRYDKGLLRWPVMAGCVAVLAIIQTPAVAAIVVDVPPGAGVGAIVSVDDVGGPSNNRPIYRVDQGGVQDQRPKPTWGNESPAWNAACEASAANEPSFTIGDTGSKQYLWPARAATWIQLSYKKGNQVKLVTAMGLFDPADTPVSGWDPGEDGQGPAAQALAERLYGALTTYRITKGSVPANSTIIGAEREVAICQLRIVRSASQWMIDSYGRRAIQPAGTVVNAATSGCTVTARDISVRTGAGESMTTPASVVLKCDSGGSLVARAFGLGDAGTLDFGTADLEGAITIQGQDATQSGVLVKMDAGGQKDLGVKIETTASESAGGHEYSATAVVVVTPS